MRKLLLLLALAGLSACQPGYHLTNRTASRLGVDSVTATADSSMARFLAPYRQELDRSMNEVLARSSHNLTAVQALCNKTLYSEKGHSYD